MRFLLCVAGLFLHCLKMFAQNPEPVVLTDSLEQKEVRKHYLAIFEDHGNRFGIEEVSSANWTDSFRLQQDEIPLNEHTGSVYWLKFTIQNQSSPHRKWLLEFFDHHINEVTFFAPFKDSSYSVVSLGNLKPFNNRNLKHKNVEFDLDLRPGEKINYFLRIKSENHNVIMPKVRSYSRFISYALIEYYLLGIFYGILGIMAIYNLLLFLALHKLSYFYYVCYVTAVALYTLCLNGLGFQFLWPEHPKINLVALEISIYLTMLFSVLFTKQFLRLQIRHPRANRVINYLLVARTVVLFMGIIFLPVLKDCMFLDLIPISASCIVAIMGLKQNKASVYFVIAYSLVFITFVITILEQYNLISSGIITVYSLNISIILDIVFLSISLADTLRSEIATRERMQEDLLAEMREKEELTQKVNRELEDKVTMRTIELNAANEKLKNRVELTNSMNIQLDLQNWKLRQNMTEIAHKHIIKPKVNFSEFQEVYSSETSCYQFLAQLKAGGELRCKKCDSLTMGKGKSTFDKRCTKCGYNESVTANTLYHKLKFPVVKAFYMSYLVFTNKDITAEDLSQIIDLRKETCSVFKRKIVSRMKKLSGKQLESWDFLILNGLFDKENAKE